MATQKAAKKAVKKATKTATKKVAKKGAKVVALALTTLPTRATFDGAFQTGTLIVAYKPKNTASPIQTGTSLGLPGPAVTMSVTIKNEVVNGKTFLTVSLTEI